MPSRAWSLGASGLRQLGQMGRCGEEVARRARDTVCPGPSPARCLLAGAQGLGSRALLSEGDLRSCPSLWKGSGAPAGCQEVSGLGACCLLSRSLPARKFPRGGEGAGEDGAGPCLGLGDSFRDTAFVPSHATHLAKPTTWLLLGFSSLARSLGLSCLPPPAPTWEAPTRRPSWCQGPSKGRTDLQPTISRPYLVSCVCLHPFPS